MLLHSFLNPTDDFGVNTDHVVVQDAQVTIVKNTGRSLSRRISVHLLHELVKQSNVLTLDRVQIIVHDRRRSRRRTGRR